METITKTQNVSLDTRGFYKIFHLDCGRKYFTVDQVKALIDMLAQYDYTSIELAIGNDGLRFLLDDMSVTVNGTTYGGTAVADGIKTGNAAYSHSGEWNQAEMDQIIAYAGRKGISVIPLINTPGHMDAILDAMETVGISNPAYNNSARTLDVTNAEAVNFTLALVNKYIRYFAGKGCTIFNMGCDEYANDVTNGFSALQGAGQYGDFINYVNNMAAQIQNEGMTAMAFNDGIYYNNVTSGGTFDENIAVAYWTSGWGGYYPASAAMLAGLGHKIINTNDSWYYVVGRGAGNTSGYTIATAKSGAQNIKVTDVPGDNDPTPAGAMQCIWCDAPNANYNADEVTELIAALAQSNPDYFSAGAGIPDDENVTVNVLVGQTATETINGANYAGSYQTADESIATVEVTGNDGTEESEIYTQATFVKCSELLGRDSSSWSETSYYYKSGENYYPLYVKRSSVSSWLRTTYTYTYGYSDDDGKNVTECGTQTYSVGLTGSDNNIVNIDLYTKSGSAAVPASTIITFTGVSAGTTTVTVGGMTYTINVTAEDLAKVDPLRIELWITNFGVASTDANIMATEFYTGVSDRPNGYYVSVSAEDAYDAAGIPLSSVVPATGRYAWSDKLVYWKGTRLTYGNKQTAAAGADKTANGDDFTYIRYYSGQWQFSADRMTWENIESSDQIVAYYLQKTTVTKEIDTLVKDWGYPVSTGDGSNQVALSVAVVYPDGTLSPATENEIYTHCTTMFNYWNNRDIGIVAPLNNSNYAIKKITVTSGRRANGRGGTWDIDDGITWDKTTNAAGIEWYNETTYWEHSMTTTPMVNGAVSDIRWGREDTAKLVLIYLEPIVTEDSLTVKYVDDSTNGTLIYQMTVAGNKDTTFYQLHQTPPAPQTDGVEFELSDDAYIIYIDTNNNEIKQYFNKDISKFPDLLGQYASGLYEYQTGKTEIADSGKTLILHYNLNSEKLKPYYIVDFGLSVTIPFSDFNTLTATVKNVGVAEPKNGTATVEGTNIVYTPSKAYDGYEVLSVTVTFDDDSSVLYNVGIYPATTVYYEETFAELNGFAQNGTAKNTLQQSLAYRAEDTAAPSGAYHYGYDAVYADDGVDASNGTYAMSTAKGDKASFTFTGTGVDIYANSTPDSGILFIQVKNSSGKTVKNVQVDTKMANGGSDATAGQSVNAYNVPIVSLNLGSRDKYTVNMTHVIAQLEGAVGAVSLDGFKVFGTLDTGSTVYVQDGEQSPNYVEVRNAVLKAVDATPNGSEQTYGAADNAGGAIIISDGNVVTGDAQDLLENGPKNEVYLRPGQSLAFDLSSGISSAQIGLKALNGSVSYKINDGDAQTMDTSTDMFYRLTAGTGVVITNTSAEGSGVILAVTDLKYFGTPAVSAIEAPSKDTVKLALMSLDLEDSGNTPETSETANEPENQPQSILDMILGSAKEFFDRFFGFGF